MMDEKRIERVEERVDWLEKHVGEQDKVMLELACELARVRRELVTLRARTTTGAAPLDPNERPPHY